MTKKEKLLARIINNQKNVRFEELEGLILNHGFEKVRSKGGSHNAYIKNDKILTVVRPHGGKKFCHPLDVQGVLEVLEEE